MKGWELLEKFGKCVGVLARDHDGDEVYPTSPDAVEFCALGVIDRCYPLPEVDAFARTHAVYRLGNRVKSVSNGYSISGWSDRATKAEVAAVFKELDL